MAGWRGGCGGDGGTCWRLPAPGASQGRGMREAALAAGQGSCSASCPLLGTESGICAFTVASYRPSIALSNKTMPLKGHR